MISAKGQTVGYVQRSKAAKIDGKKALTLPLPQEGEEFQVVLHMLHINWNSDTTKTFDMIACVFLCFFLFLKVSNVKGYQLFLVTKTISFV